MGDARRAWVMDVGGGTAVAAGAAHVVEYLLAAEARPVPRTPRHCAGLMLWRDRLVPVIDLAQAVAGRAAARPRHAVILAYQQAAGRPLQYGALLVTAPPAETWVRDDMACALPDSRPGLARLARGCFAHHDRAVVILDPRRLFDEPLPDPAEPPTAATAPDAERPAPVAGGETVVAAVDAPPPVRRERVASPVPYLQVVTPPAASSSVATAPAAPEVPAGAMSGPADDTAEPAIDFTWPEPPEPVEVATPTLTTPATADPAPAATALSAPLAPAAATATPPPATEPARPPSNSVRSFERLRDLERRHSLTGYRAGRWLLRAAAGLGLAAILAWGLASWRGSPPADGARPPAASAPDAAALTLRPASVPSTPAQPPD